jgi:hypothetical protein
LNHAPWNPNGSSKHNEEIGKHDARKIRLTFVNAFVWKRFVNPQQHFKMMQIWIVIKVIGKGMMGTRVLMLPQDGVANHGHAPNTPFIPFFLVLSVTQS